jgi:MarR family 2-MHQ and catechol resistance regulon transcriptional repressor
MKKSDDLGHYPDSATASLELLLVLNILRTHNYLNPHIDNSLRDLKLRAGQFNALCILYAESGKGVPLGEIGRRLVVSKANITGLIDRLEQKGLVCRSGSDDRRITEARLTTEGIRLIEEVLPRHRTLVSNLMDCLNTQEKRRLIELLTKLRFGLRAKCRCGGKAAPGA